MSPDHRRALSILADCPAGCTEAMMLAHGFSIESMVELIRAGLATATTERMIAGRKEVPSCALSGAKASRTSSPAGP
jgi:hypothetical protein